jgi:hypothetical protein
MCHPTCVGADKCSYRSDITAAAGICTVNTAIIKRIVSMQCENGFNDLQNNPHPKNGRAKPVL